MVNFLLLINPITKSLLDCAIFTACSVYSPTAKDPSIHLLVFTITLPELISANSNNPRSFGLPTSLSPSIIPFPGIIWALTMCAQSAM